MDFSVSVDRRDTAGFFVNPGMDNSHDRDRISSRVKGNDCLAWSDQLNDFNRRRILPFCA